MRAATVLALAAVALAQDSVPEYESSLNMTLNNINAIPDNERNDWCRGQSNSCRTLCDDDAVTNDCDYLTLEYECLCAANDSAPGLQYYTATMPTFICKAAFSECINQYANDADGQEDCETNIDDLCGTLDIADADVGGGDDDDDDSSETSATSASPSATGDSDNNDDENSDDVTSTNSDDFAAPTAGPKVIAALGALGLVAVLQ